MKKGSYFSHDADARRNPKIIALISKYGMSGYGRFWVILEMLREQENYSLQCKNYVYTAIGKEISCNEEETRAFIDELVNEFELLQTSDNTFWSKSLKERMEKMEEKSSIARKKAEKRWDIERKREKDKE